MPDLTLHTVDSISDIPQATWERFSGTTSPFLRHQFLQALEESGCTSPTTGWAPCHLKILLDDELVGLAPGYLKSHSMGEYVFDWAWADAYRHHGQDYYPKLVIAVPFTPSQGARLLLAPQARDRINAAMLHRALDTSIRDLGAHSWHLLFPDATDQALLEHPRAIHRLGCQFHWHNRGYSDFDGFLATLTSRKRKSIKRERRQVKDQGIRFRHYPGDELPDTVLDTFYRFYQATYHKRGQRPYLNPAFFRLLRDRQGEQLYLVMAEQDGRFIAGALFLLGSDTLYGRYWGCLQEFNHLHFETCYYQGIELAIARGLNTFDAGAQGEHKLIRGFTPELTHSWHGIAHPGFRAAIHRFCDEEAAQVAQYRDDALGALPYRAETSQQ
ncbi:GNAT family N-acetyltransferase [Marinobacter sp. SS21]|uniref:GNAT family N-acetyltransferase n=1 Tax=Marinobacter sp. SS21 TaxID=2979460 RepID=UPI0023301637|nr:GNAT family N-acetyltransferase [Marinobacter sp. SS21]MDC0661588.1 GNAT family N-acetyltransferase [Marinobacter sp. SS21]